LKLLPRSLGKSLRRRENPWPRENLLRDSKRTWVGTIFDPKGVEWIGEHRKASGVANTDDDGERNLGGNPI